MPSINIAIKQRTTSPKIKYFPIESYLYLYYISSIYIAELISPTSTDKNIIIEMSNLVGTKMYMNNNVSL